MARIIVITSGKGGVGKTTTTANIGMALARSGNRTLLVDADVGLRNLDLLLGLENRIIYTGLDVLTKTCRLEQALIKDKRQPNLTFFPLAPSRSEINITIEQVTELITSVENLFDFILIDSPAGIDSGFLTAIECANEAIVVVTPEVPSIRDADRVIGIMMSKKLSKLNLVVNRIRPEMVKTDDMMSIDDVTSILGIPLIGVIPDTQKVIIASNRGEPVVLEEKISFPRIAFENTAKRLIGQQIDFIELESTTNPNPIRSIFRKFRLG